MRLAQETLVEETECKVCSRGIYSVVPALSEDVTCIGKESGKVHRVCISIAECDIAHHHENTCRVLHCLGKAAPLAILYLCKYLHLDINAVIVLYKYLVLVEYLVFQFVFISVFGARRHLQFLALEVVDKGDCSVHLQCNLFCERFRLLCFLCRLGL